MIDNKKNPESDVSSFKNKYVDYRHQTEQTKGFDAQLTKVTRPPAPELAEKTDKAPGKKTSELAAQKALIEGDNLPTDQLSPKMTQYSPYIKQAASQYNLPPELIAGIIWQESRGNPKAQSHCGAMGLMQLMPETASRLGVKNPFDPADNINGGAKYIRQMLDKFSGKVELAVAAYNAGPGNVIKHGYKIPPFKETQDYVPKVLGYADNFKASGLFIESTTTMRA
ncbi:MAG: lytic transglycosylase domain-containing protein [Deltaproteobacteria bacterium]|nr:lytic transglycosylase domain-containing protein [Deltaproteobacteria bacterium]